MTVSSMARHMGKNGKATVCSFLNGAVGVRPWLTAAVPMENPYGGCKLNTCSTRSRCSTCARSASIS